MDNRNQIKYVKDYFNSKSDKYGNREADRFRDIPNFIKEHNKGGIILDIGCGKGEFVNYIEDNFNDYAVIGLDISKSMLKARKARSDFILADALWLPFKNNCLDIIYMDALLHHVISDTKTESNRLQIEVINGSLNLLRTNGYLIIQELYYNFILSKLDVLYFHVLKLLAKFKIKNLFGETIISIDFKNYRGWIDFFYNFKDRVNYVSLYKIPQILTYKYKFLGVMETGNIILYFTLKDI